MSRLSSRAQEFLRIQTRGPHISTAILTKTQSQSSRISLRSSAKHSKDLKIDTDNLFTLPNKKDLINELPLKELLSVPRGNFQLSSPPSIKIKDSQNIPVAPIYKNSHLRLIEDMEKMIPRSIKNKKNMRLCLRNSIRQLTSLKLKPGELVYVNKLIPQIPYGRPNSRLFFQYVKEGNLMQVEVMLTQDKYLAHVFDPIKMTALHWACLRGYEEIVKTLLVYSAFIDAVDISHRTALHIAAKSGFADIVMILIENDADPSVLTVKKQSALQMAKNEKIRDILKRFMREKYFHMF